MSDTTARDARIAALLRKCADELSPVRPVIKVTPPKAAKKAAQKAPEAVTLDPRVFTGICLDCGKGGLLANVLCGKCKKARFVAGLTVPAKAPITERKVAAKVAPEAPAKVRDTSNMGRRSPKAHCAKDNCGLFVPAGAKKCAKGKGCRA